MIDMLKIWVCCLTVAFVAMMALNVVNSNRYIEEIKSLNDSLIVYKTLNGVLK